MVRILVLFRLVLWLWANHFGSPRFSLHMRQSEGNGALSCWGEGVKYHPREGTQEVLFGLPVSASWGCGRGRVGGG